jgi:SAM-dependent methyltransferase
MTSPAVPRSAQYQSFPDVVGDSRTLDKLKALMLPLGQGVRFLDVGCNEGFFCGFAHYQGAARVVGVDISAGYVQRARQRFPECEFIHGSWDALPGEEFDVILLASALHYAEDQPALLHTLVERLAPNGVLVLELGIVASRACDWIKVQRGDDERLFPSMAKLREVLQPYAWKWMGPSVTQPGDPVPRHVVHVSRRRPLAYLMLEPPGTGKSTIAASLFGAGGVPVLSNDELLRKVAKGELDADPALVDLVRREFTPFGIDRMLALLVAEDHVGALVDLWLAQAGGSDFALDGFLPVGGHGLVQQRLSESGYLPVRMSWDRSGRLPPPPDMLQEQAEAFYRSLAGEVAPGPDFSPPAVVTGFVDEIVVEAARIGVRGWAVDPDGNLPRVLAVRIGEHEQCVDAYAHEQRPDVQRHFHLRHDLLGFRLSVSAPVGVVPQPEDVHLFGGSDPASLVGPFARAKDLDGESVDGEQT